MLILMLSIVIISGCSSDKSSDLDKNDKESEIIDIEKTTQPAKKSTIDCEDISIGTQIWEGCNEGSSKNSDKGEFYYWTDVESACQEGYHVPSKEEWAKANSDLMKELTSEWKLSSLREFLKISIYENNDENPEIYEDNVLRGFYWTSDYQYYKVFTLERHGAGGSPSGIYSNVKLKIRCIKD